MPENLVVCHYCFRNLAKDWYDSICVNVKFSTQVKYHNMLINYALPLLGHLPVNQIGYIELEGFAKKLLSNCENRENGLSHKTVSDVLTMVRSILKYGQRKGYSVSLDAFAYQLKSVQKPIRVFNRREQQQICNILYEDMSIWNLGILFALFTGLRVGELCALKWEDISFEDLTVRVNKTMQRIQTLDGSPMKTKIIISTPKTNNSIRFIPITQNLIPVLESFQRKPETYFLSDKKHLYTEPRMMQRHFKKILETCGINGASFHTLRHTFATRCVEMDFDVKSLSEILGHSNVSITMNRYVHPSMELKRKNIEKLSSLLNGVSLNDTNYMNT